MKTHTIEDIRKLKPCYDPAKYLPEDWTGTALDILNVVAAPAGDRIWVVLKPSWTDDRTLRLFAVLCAREALKLIYNPDPRSVEACNVAERYANGNATDDELKAAGAAAWAAASDAAGDAACNAAGAAAWAVTRDATRAASGAAAWAASSDAAWAAASDAARDAACNAAAWAATRDAAWTASRDAQVEKLKELLG